MIEVTDELFEKMIGEAMDELPEEYISGLNNVVVTFEDYPTTEQRQKQQIRPNQTLYGLYEGIPMIKRGAGYNLVLPDKITIFKGPITHGSASIELVKQQVKHTLWHEIAHHYGLDHDRIHKIEGEWK
jgi:predicted Zn-dependent protease with MMP-like domain